MKIEYVVSSMVFWGRENTLSFEPECQLLKSLGYGIELWPNASSLDECRYDEKHWPRLIAATEDMLVSMRSRSDKPTLRKWADQIECARLLGANIVTSLRSLDICEEKGLNGSDFLSEIVAMAETADVKLCLETGPLPILKQLGEKFKSLEYCIDVGYANLDSKFGFKQYVDELAPRTTHLHLTDNYGQVDDHQPPGVKGGISRENWDYLLDALNKYDHKIIGSLEMCPCMPEVMIRKAGEFIFDELNWPNQPHEQSPAAAAVPKRN